MDLFSHVLVAYLLTFGITGLQVQYLAAGALAGGLPDADALLFPLSRRWPILRHHGITHSLLGVTVIAVVGALVAPLILPGSPWLYFVVMEVGGCAHILQDGFTNFAVPPLAPFSERKLEMDADRAINFTTLLVSVVGFYLLLGVERNAVSYSIYLGTLWAFAGFFVAYFALRLTARLYVGRRLTSLGDYDHVVPTSNPFVWVVISERKSADRMRTTFGRYVLGRGLTQGPLTVDVPLEVSGPIDRPITGPEDALERSYPLARHASRFLAETYHFGYVHDEGAAGTVVTWYSLEFGAFGRSAAVDVRFPPRGGAPTVKNAFRRIPAPWTA
ncbi:MAG: metal-dependent hydrolase [Thermoplasmata archaeon]